MPSQLHPYLWEVKKKKNKKYEVRWFATTILTADAVVRSSRQVRARVCVLKGRNNKHVITTEFLCYTFLDFHPNIRIECKEAIISLWPRVVIVRATKFPTLVEMTLNLCTCRFPVSCCLRRHENFRLFERSNT